VQIPVYEFLPALGMLLTLAIASLRGLFTSRPGFPFQRPVNTEALSQPEASFPEPELPAAALEINFDTDAAPLFSQRSDAEASVDGILAIAHTEDSRPGESETPASRPAWHERLFSLPPASRGTAAWLPTAALLIYWSLMSLLAFSYAGERMPWLTTHITMPLILSAAWGLGFIVESTDWRTIFSKKGFLVILLSVIALLAASGAVRSLTGSNPPFQGKELAQLQATSTFLLAITVSLATLGGLISLLKGWQISTILRVVVISFFFLLSMITTRTAYRAAYINYDNAKEFLVYAQ